MAVVIAIILAVVVDRYVRTVSSGKALHNLRSATWLNIYLDKGVHFLEKLSIKQPYLIILAAILPLCIALFLIKILICSVLGQFLGRFIFTFITLFYFLGIDDVQGHESEYVLAHETSFGVLFWYAVLGFSGALIYWFFVMAKQAPVIKDVINAALLQALTWLHAMAAWVPARITGFIYALVGNFEPGFKTWLNCARDAKLSSSQVLQECGKAATEQNSLSSANLVNRAFIAWVVLSVIIVIIR